MEKNYKIEDVQDAIIAALQENDCFDYEDLRTSVENEFNAVDVYFNDSTNFALWYGDFDCCLTSLVADGKVEKFVSNDNVFYKLKD